MRDATQPAELVAAHPLESRYVRENRRVEWPHRVKAKQAQADVAEVDAVESPVVKALGPERTSVADPVGEDPRRVCRLVAVLPRGAEDFGEVVRALLPDAERLERRPIRGSRPLHRLAQSVALGHPIYLRNVPEPQADPKSLARIQRDGVEDYVAVEEPLEIRVDGSPLAVTMRTPGNDEELALGFLYGEGLIDGTHDAGLTDDLAGNVVEVAGPLLRDPGARSFYTTSSCGVCGKGAIEQVEVMSAPLADGPEIERDLLAVIPDRLRQPAFERTGGLHATGLFDQWGETICVREDVGRHNAMDKVIGWALREELAPLRDYVLCVSGRLSFELVQKACVAGAPILVGVGAPSSLAIELAQERGLTLAGFARNGSVNVYAGVERVRG
jgi:FdhD protein